MKAEGGAGVVWMLVNYCHPASKRCSYSTTPSSTFLSLLHALMNFGSVLSSTWNIMLSCVRLPDLPSGVAWQYPALSVLCVVHAERCPLPRNDSIMNANSTYCLLIVQPPFPQICSIILIHELKLIQVSEVGWLLFLERSSPDATMSHPPFIDCHLDYLHFPLYLTLFRRDLSHSLILPNYQHQSPTPNPHPR